ncbi:hypothetical protein FQA39_LY13172 [Lamprigera yunnana]|nr:hypothetical protein FQA39_LY13172 [Lamprigera yunnana]
MKDLLPFEKKFFLAGPKTPNLMSIFPAIEPAKLKRTSSAIWNKTEMSTLASSTNVEESDEDESDEIESNSAQFSEIFESVREAFIDENVYRDNFELVNEYDFIIVGAGSAGSVLANRLSENVNWSILVLEAGIEENYYTDVPLLAPFQTSTGFNWNFHSQRSNKSCLSLKNNRCSLPRGKAVGGTSVINFLVYTRGNKLDFDEWQTLGNKGWAYKEVLPYFKKSENCSTQIKFDAQYRGTNGPLTVEYSKFCTPIRDFFLKSSTEFGVRNTDPNGKFHIGFSQVQATMMNGRRCSAAKAYLKPIVARQNLFILTKATVTKILIDPATKRAYGVEFVRNGRKRIIKSKKEIVLSAGSFKSPQLLMLSGVGPRDNLEQLNIPVIANLKVGYNLQDHCVFVQSFLVNETVTLSDLSVAYPTHMFNYWFNAKGPFTLPAGVEALAFMKTKYNTFEDRPDVEFVLGSAGLNNDLFGSVRNTFSLPDTLFYKIYGPILLLPSFSISTILLKPKSKGRILLKNRNPFVPPLIYTNYFEDDSDIDVFAEGLLMAKRLGESSFLKRLDSKLYEFTIPACRHLPKSSKQHLICLIRNLATTLGHQVGTCKMGPSSDPEAVVDPELKVYGVQNLRVIDGSVMPNIIAGHTNSVIMMIAEKGADLIKNTWKS